MVISAQTSGTVTRLTLEEGEKTVPGDLLATIDVEKLELAAPGLVAGLGEVAASRLATDAEIARAEETLANTDIQYNRIKKLHARGSATQKQMDDMTTQQIVAKNQVAVARPSSRCWMPKKPGSRRKLPSWTAGLQTARSSRPSAAPFRRNIWNPVKPPCPEPGFIKLRIWLISGKHLCGRRRPWKDHHRPTRHREADAVERPFQGTVAWTSPEAEFTPKNVQTRQARSELVYAVKVTLDASDPVLKIGMPVEVFLKS